MPNFIIFFCGKGEGGLRPAEIFSDFLKKIRHLLQTTPLFSNLNMGVLAAFFHVSSFISVVAI